MPPDVPESLTPFVYKLPFEHLSCQIADEQKIPFLGFHNPKRQQVNFRQIFNSAQAGAEGRRLMQSLLAAIRAGRKPVIGMVQLDALPRRARDTWGAHRALCSTRRSRGPHSAENGIDVLMVQNLGDLPVGVEATAAQVAWMTRDRVRNPPRSACLSGSISSRTTPRPCSRSPRRPAPTSSGSRSMSAR